MFRKQDLYSSCTVNFFFLTDLKGKEGRKDIRVGR
jgi:hypothetical protein